MSKGYQAKMPSDGQVFVVLHTKCQISSEEILSLLQEAGIDPEDVVFVTPEGALSCADIGDNPVLIPLDAEACDAADLELAARHCGNAGARVIAVFGPGFSYAGLHPIADKYGTQCGWSSRNVSSCISGPDNDSPPVDGTGSKTRRHRVKPVDC